MHEPLDEAQAIITRGVQAQALLDNEAFVWIVNDQTQYHLAALCATLPGPAGAADRGNPLPTAARLQRACSGPAGLRRGRRGDATSPSGRTRG